MFHTSSPSVPRLPPAPGAFGPAFFQFYEPDSAQRVLAEIESKTSSISYSADRYRSHAEFCQSPDFERYRQEVRESLDFLVLFCSDHGVLDVEAVSRRFDTFFAHRFEEAYFHTQASRIDGPGKRSLDNFCAMVRDDRFPLDKRIAGILDLSHGVVVCAPVSVANLVSAARDLALSIGGLKGLLWKLKEDHARQILRREMAAKFGREERYRNNESHDINALWNLIADTMGFKQLDDSGRKMDAAFVAACRDKVLAALTPDRLAGLVAEQCRDRFASELAIYGKPASGECTAEMMEAFSGVIHAVGDALGLDGDTLELHAFVALDDDMPPRYVIRTDASLIARAVLRGMHTEQLLVDVPVNRGEWLDDRGDRHALFTYGSEAAWQAQLTGMESDEHGWSPRLTSDLITVSDLLAWSSAPGREREAPPAAALRQAIRCSGVDDLANVPQHWLVDAGSVVLLLDRLGEQQARQFLQSNLSYLLNGFPPEERNGVLDRVIGMGDAALVLARAWCPNPWALLAHGHPDTRLYRWMTQGNVPAIEAAITLLNDREDRWCAWQAPAFKNADGGGSPSGSGPPLWKPAEILDLLVATPTELPPLHAAMAANHADAVDAWGRLLCEPGLVDGLSVRSLVSSLASLSGGGSALGAAMRGNCAAAIKAMQALLTAPAVAARISGDLPGLIEAADTRKYPGLLSALMRGNVAAIEAYTALLADPRITPHVKEALPRLLAAKDTQRAVPGVLGAIEHGKVSAIRAYHALLRHPAVVPHIEQALPDLLAARVPHSGTCGLAFAMEYGYAGVIDALHAMLADPIFLPHIAPALPGLVEARRTNGMPGLALALRNGHVAAIKAFHEMLRDPAILPHIAPSLPDLLAARDGAGTPGLALALEALQPAAAAAFYSILADRDLAAFLGDKKAELMLAPGAASAPVPATAAPAPSGGAANAGHRADAPAPAANGNRNAARGGVRRAAPNPMRWLMRQLGM